MKPGEYYIVEYEPKYAASLAQMWNESDSVWPGTNTRGVPITEEMMLDWKSQQRYLNTYLALADERVVGICELVEHSQVEEAAYVGILGVHPQYHRRGYGRELLKRAIERSIELGCKRLDLDTWPGNLRAIPLYKRTGFFWVPETEVDMVNYLPLILAHPLTEGFFREADWYEHFQRHLSLQEDDYRQGDMRVFPYEWEKDGRRLRVVIDRATGGIVALENERFSASCEFPRAKIPAGTEGSIEWRICSKGGRPLPVSLLAEERGGVQVEKVAALEVMGETKLSATVRAPTEPATGGERPSVRTVLLIEGQPLTLEAGLECPPPIELSTEPPRMSLVPGVEKEMCLRLKNHLPAEIKGTLFLTPGLGLKLEPKQAEFAIPAQGLAGIPITLAAERGGALSFSAHVALNHSGQKLETRPQEFQVLSVPIGGIAAYRNERETVLENDHFRLVIEHSRAGARLEEKATARPLVGLTSTLGPPFPWGRRTRPAKVELRQEAGKIVAVEMSHPKEYPGLAFQREFSLTPGPTLELRHTVLNAGSVEHHLQVKLGQRPARWQEAGRVLALPLQSGLVIEPDNHDFPDWRDPKDYRPERYAENWQALLWPEGPTIGRIWRRATRVERAEELTLDLGTIPPQGRAESEPVYIYAGYGGWQDVRRYWQMLSGQAAGDGLPKPHPALDVKLLPEPAIISRQGETKLSIRNERSYALAGKVRLSLPVGWEASQREWELSGVSKDAPFAAPLCLEKEAPPFADICQAELALEVQQEARQFQFPIMSIGDGQTEVEVKESREAGQPIVALGSGRLKLKVAPQFAGSLYSLSHQGQEQLMSPFPEARPFAWMNPWYGGFRPTLRLADQRTSRTHLEKFQHRLIERRGPRGLLWRGICLSTNLTQEALRGLDFEVEYLTTGQSNLVAMVLRVVNATTAPFRLRAALEGFPQVGGKPEALLHYLGGGEERMHKPVPEWLESEAGAWAALEDTATGLMGVLVAGSEEPRVSFSHMGQEGTLLACTATFRLGPQEVKELVSYFLFTDSLEKARLYRALTQAQGLV